MPHPSELARLEQELRDEGDVLVRASLAYFDDFPEVEVVHGQLGLATSAELAQELRVRLRVGHTDPNYRTSEKDDPTNYRYELRKLRREMAEMAERAAAEMRNLRTRNERLSSDADAYATVRSIVGLLPRASEGAEVDFAWRLEQRAKELRSEIDD